ncbi:DUF6491 family protein [Paraglaciecola sp. L3A3]|uniref:DUF6491 family protein n=1 Tax=Paraglaciecola sp. L3A3 TaxID=2686358 RepID=UPI00131B361B|nr:DUF6491 family protein [Paraglaciecola sp. L3A3]
MNIFKFSTVVIAFFSLVSCSSLYVDLPNYDELLKTETTQDGRACVRQNDIRGYGTLDDDVISVSVSPRNQYYLITTLFRCDSLLTSFAAGFKGNFSELCGGGRDKILTSDESCPIKSIFEFESREDAFATFEKAKTIRQDLRKEAEEQTAKNKTTE